MNGNYNHPSNSFGRSSNFSGIHTPRPHENIHNKIHKINITHQNNTTHLYSTPPKLYRHPNTHLSRGFHYTSTVGGPQSQPQQRMMKTIDPAVTHAAVRQYTGAMPKDLAELNTILKSESEYNFNFALKQQERSGLDPTTGGFRLNLCLGKINNSSIFAVDRTTPSEKSNGSYDQMQTMKKEYKSTHDFQGNKLDTGVFEYFTDFVLSESYQTWWNETGKNEADMNWQQSQSWGQNHRSNFGNNFGNNSGNYGNNSYNNNQYGTNNNQGKGKGKGKGQGQDLGKGHGKGKGKGKGNDHSEFQTQPPAQTQQQAPPHQQVFSPDTAKKLIDLLEKAQTSEGESNGGPSGNTGGGAGAGAGTSGDGFLPVTPSKDPMVAAKKTILRSLIGRFTSKSQSTRGKTKKRSRTARISEFQSNLMNNARVPEIQQWCAVLNIPYPSTITRKPDAVVILARMMDHFDTTNEIDEDTTTIPNTA